MSPNAPKHFSRGKFILMSSSFDRQRAERLAVAIREKKLRDERKRQSNLGGPGYSGGLMDFIRYFWHVLEPNTPLVEGWALRAICLHLEAVTRGEIKRLLINTIPGSAKSLIVNVMWPAWEWSAAGKPYLRYVTFAYASHLTERDNGRFRDILQCPEFKEIWGHKLVLTSNGVIKPTNSAKGWKFSSSIDGVGTGERGNRILCLPGSERILTSVGWLPIRDIVERRLDVKVAGFDHRTNAVVWQEIEAYERNPGNEIFEISCEGGSLRSTGDHPVFVQGREYARADSLKAGDVIIWAGSGLDLHSVLGRDKAQTEPAPDVLQPRVSDCIRAGTCPETQFKAVRSMRHDDLSCAISSQEIGRSLLQPRVPWQGEWGRCQSSIPGWDGVASLQAVRGSLREKERCGNKVEFLFGIVRGFDEVGCECVRAAASIPSAVPSMLEIVSTHAQRNEVLLPGMRERGPFGENEGGWERPLCSRGGTQAVSAGLDQKLQSADQGSRWGSLPDVRENEDIRAPELARSSHRLRQEQPEPRQPNHALSVLPRQAAWRKAPTNGLEEKIVYGVKAVGREDVVYNVRVGPCHNYFASGFLVHNCDDIHNVREGESEKVRSGTVQWVKEGMSNRLNDMQEDVIVAIGQRVHEDDSSAAMIESGDYVHLCIPMEFDPSRRCVTDWWEDPRTEFGELAWPERFPAKVVSQIKRTLGPYAYCTPHESPVLMGDLSLKPIGDVQVGETVIGFTIDNAPRSPNVKFSRRRLVRSTVVSVSRSVRKVVRMTLDSGRVIRCTPDHKWYTGRTEAHRPTYMPAVVGRPLMRICDPEMPRLSEDDIRAAGWLAGFFDGEGSAVMSQKGKNYEPSCLISFTQGYGQNEPLCHKLESVLTQLGFEYGFQERPQPAGHVVRWYYLTKGSWALPVHQRFVHVVQPTKWRDRIIDGALGTRFILGEEKVVSIEDDGEEEVFGLETTTGNYVVWGLASSNSSQYQQAPEPRGGGILKRDWWGAYELPVGAPFRHPFEFIVASLDPAFTAKQENDPSGFTVWGVYSDSGRVRIVLLHAWQKWLELHGQTMERLPGEKNTEYVRRTSDKWGLVEWVAHDCRRLKVNALLIEAKASGHSVAQEIRRLYADNTWGVRLINPGVLDKRARAYAVQHLFADGIIQAPAAPSGDVLVFREWAQMVIDEAAKFRGLAGEEDNLVDSLTQALKFLRDNGLATRDEERMADERERMTAGTGDRPTPLYDV